VNDYKDLTSLYGRIIYMAMRTDVYRPYRLADFDRLFVPPIMLGQYYTLEHEDILLGFVSWANLTQEAEAGFLNRSRKLQPNDWNAGDHSRIWIIDCLAPWGGIMKMARQISKSLRDKADAGDWPARRARWTRTHGDAVVQHVGYVARWSPAPHEAKR
jgi:hemolysin-activating ACP:hemolysin acyltransferase